MLMKVINILFAVLFFIAAVLQYNDPDPYIWIPIYGFAAFICAQAARHRFYPAACVVGILILSLYACFLFFAPEGVWDWFTSHEAEDIAATMKATKPWIEQTREFFGLIIIIISLLLNYYFAKRNRRVISV